MKATPISPGSCYRVTCRGHHPITVLADHPCTAINQVLEIYFHV
jgi:hypothetical protein